MPDRKFPEVTRAWFSTLLQHKTQTRDLQHCGGGDKLSCLPSFGSNISCYNLKLAAINMKIFKDVMP